MDDDGGQLDGLSSLVRLSGIVVPARARFVGETLIWSVVPSLTLGLSFGMASAALSPIGPLIPFMIGSWTGYTFGLYDHWQACTRRMSEYAQSYPTLMAHALRTERNIIVPQHVLDASVRQLCQKKQQANNNNKEKDTKSALNEWIHQGGLARISWSVLAAQSCMGDVQELQRQQRQQLMEEHQEMVAGGSAEA